MVLDALLVVVVLVVCLFVCFVIACHCKITAYVGDNKLILILSILNKQQRVLDEWQLSDTCPLIHPTFIYFRGPRLFIQWPLPTGVTVFFWRGDTAHSQNSSQLVRINLYLQLMNSVIIRPRRSR